jgi:hypothetical protein
LGPSVEHELQVGSVSHVFQDQDYKPPYPLHGWAVPPETELTTPERTLVRLAAAIEALDWNMSNLLWDPVSRAQFEAEMAKHGVTPADRVELWKKAYAGKKLEAYRLRRIPGYTLVYVGAEGEDAEARAKALPLALKQDAAGRFWLTHDLRENPVFALDLLMPEDGKLLR